MFSDCSVRRRIFAVALGLAALGLAACEIGPTEEAPAGANPPIATAVGPIPGIGQVPGNAVNPYATDRVALSQGRELFVHYNCYGCHGGHGGGGMGPSLRDQVWLYGSSDAHVFESIAQGRAHGMPSWGTKLPQDQIWKLAAYVKSLRSPYEPDPPQE